MMLCGFDKSDVSDTLKLNVYYCLPFQNLVLWRVQRKGKLPTGLEKDLMMVY